MGHDIPVLQVKASTARSALLVVMAAGMAGVSWGLVAGRAPALGWVGVGFFSWCALVLLTRMVRLRGPVLTVDAGGLHDRRVSRLPVPWSAVRAAGVWQLGAEQVLVLTVDDDVWDQVGVLALPRRARAANRALGADGLCFTTRGLPVAFEDLLAAVSSYVPHLSPPRT